MQTLPLNLVARVLLGIAVVILVVAPFHAFLTVWLSSFVGFYTGVRLWKEVLLAIVLIGMAYLLWRQKPLRERLMDDRLVRRLLQLTALYVLLHILLGAAIYVRGEVSLQALGYGLISNLRYLLFFTACLTLAAHIGKPEWHRWLLWPAALVVAFGLMQFFVLPPDFLRHFGYGPDTIKPYIAVDQKIEYVRVQSSLRGPNPLGAYLVIIITAAAAMFVKQRRYAWPAVLLLGSAIVLYGTYSRSAWIGLTVSLFVLGWLLARPRARKVLLAAVAGLAVIFAGMLITYRDNDHVQNVFFHTDESSGSSRSTNEDRASALETGFRHVLNEPLGRGPGTAGPASQYNDEHGGARIAENYFIQIGQEVGMVGIGLFAAICVYAGRLLWRLGRPDMLGLVLLASLVGLSAVNLVSHAWTDDTLAYVWWGFAGLIIGSSLKERHSYG